MPAKALVQVIDNGGGMSETDARCVLKDTPLPRSRPLMICFISGPWDFAEALASIAAVAQVELKTKAAG